MNQDADVVAYVTYVVAAAASAAALLIAEMGTPPEDAQAETFMLASAPTAQPSSGTDAEKVTPRSVGWKLSSKA